MSAGGSIWVDPAALHGLGDGVRRHAQRGREVAGQATQQATVSTGEPELDAELQAFSHRWHDQVSQVSELGEGLAQAIVAAGVAYRRTDATAVPGSLGPDEGGGS